jgi:hypothetical protein
MATAALESGEEERELRLARHVLALLDELDALLAAPERSDLRDARRVLLAIWCRAGLTLDLWTHAGAVLRRAGLIGGVTRESLTGEGEELLREQRDDAYQPAAARERRLQLGAVAICEGTTRAHAATEAALYGGWTCTCEPCALLRDVGWRPTAQD